MKFNSTLLAALVLGATAYAAPLTQPTPVYSSPESSAPVIATLKAGAEPAAAPATTAPSGWTAVTLPGPHDVYTLNKDVTKSLDVRVGAPYLADAKPDATILAHAEKDDPIEITDYRGKWTKFRLDKPLIGYVRTSDQTTPAIRVSQTTPPPARTESPAPIAPPSQPAPAIGKAAPVGDGGSSALPRLFQGRFASTYSPFRPRRPYAYQLNDNSGARYAYVDVSKLLATEQLNKYLDRIVVVYGTAQAVPDSKDMVVIAESLQLR